jgi:hypothetical protein
MIYLLLKGGLGNQLFQIFTLISYSMRENIDFKLPYFSFCKRKNTYWDTLLLNLKDNTIDYTNIQVHKKYLEKEFIYNNIDIEPLDPKFNLLLDGYFQSYKYFVDDYENICKLIHLDDIKININPIYNNLITNSYTTISVHFRLGDYKNLQDYHPILTYEYYNKALKYLIKPNEIYNVLYFCEELDKDLVEFIIFRLKKQFININFIQCPFDIEDWKQMVLMSLCNNHIIANSTFSWWGAYFNNREKKVCYPSIWFGKNLQHYNLKDLFPSDWIEIKN